MCRNFYVTALAMLGLVGTSYAANPVIVDSAGSGDFTTIQAAINSWCIGGSNAGETAPFVINIKAGSGPYDEPVTLEEGLVGKGNIAGNIEIKSGTAGVPVVLKLQPTVGSLLNPAATQGMIISQKVNNVTFRDIVFTRSLTSLPVHALIRQDEDAANATLNTLAFYNCVFTEVTAAGNPMTTTKAGALVAPPARGGAARSAGAYLLQNWEDANESMNVILDTCVFYGGSSINCYVRSDGAGTEKVTVHNTLSSYAGLNCFLFGGVNPAGVVEVTGTDVTQGPLNCSAALFPGGANHAVLISLTVAGQNSTFSHFMADSSAAPSLAGSRGISGGPGNIFLSNVIINALGPGVVDTTNVPTTWDRVTVNCPNNAYLWIAGGTGSLTITNSILSGSGAKIGGTAAVPAGFVTVKNSALPTTGTHAITSKGTMTEINNIYDDPKYASTDFKLNTYFDVSNGAYFAAGVGGNKLEGGANYAGPPADVRDWDLY